jgi:SAM-dependent methyltransferase
LTLAHHPGIAEVRKEPMIREAVMQAGAARLLALAARLGVPDLLAEGPRTSDELAARLQAHAPTLHRLLRGWVACGVLGEREDGRFELLAAGRPLCRNAPDTEWYTLVEWAEVVDPAMRGLDATVRTGGTAFDHVFGMSVWDYRAAHPEAGRNFNANVAAATARAANALLQACDFAGAQLVVDVGGGEGALVGAVLQAHPALRGIVFDRLPGGAAARLQSLGVADRCEVRSGDFFEAVPAGADIYLLKAIVHDWNDEEALRILRNCRRAMKPGARLLLVERAAPDRAFAGSETIFSDVLMLVLEHGRERTEAQMRALLASAGFDAVVRRPIPIPDGCLLEATAS